MFPEAASIDPTRFGGLNSTAWTAITGSAQVILVVIWIAVTRSYVKSSKRQADASEGLLVVSEKQAQAATLQAKAAESQTQAIREQLYYQKELKHESNLIARRVIAAAIQRSLLEIEYWKSLELAGYFEAQTFPQIQLLPQNVDQVVEAAARLSTEISSELASGLDQLRLAERELIALRGTKSFRPFATALTSTINQHLNTAFVELDSARHKLALSK